MVYAKINNPEWVDYDMYMSDIEEDKDVIIDGGRDFKGINADQLTCIKKLIDDYYDYNLSVYYNNSVKDFIIDMLPKKDNKKTYSPKEIHIIKKALDSEYQYSDDHEREVILTCLSIIKHKKYKAFRIRGNMQGEVAYVYAPKDTKQVYIDYVEAVYFGLGSEIEVNDSETNKDIQNANDINGYCFYTNLYDENDIKEEIAAQENCDKKDVVLFKFKGYTKIEDYERC